MGSASESEKGNTNMDYATQKAAGEKKKYGDGCSTMIAIDNQTGISLQLADLYTVGEFQGDLHREPIKEHDWLAFLHGHPRGKSEGSFGAMSFSAQNKMTGQTHYFSFSWGTPWRLIGANILRKNVIQGLLSTEKPNLKHMTETTDPMKGKDSFHLESPTINGIKIVLEGHITKDTTPMFKIQIKKEGVYAPNPLHHVPQQVPQMAAENAEALRLEEEATAAAARFAAKEAEEQRLAEESFIEQERLRIEEGERQAAAAAEAEAIRVEQERLASEAEAQRLADEAQLAAEAEAERLRVIEEERIAAENAEALRVEQEAEAEAARQTTNARLSEEQRLADEAQLAAEAQAARLRIEEDERIAAENADALRVEQEQAEAAAEAARLEEERIKAEVEAQRLADEAQLAAEAEAERLRVIEEERIAAENAAALQQVPQMALPQEEKKQVNVEDFTGFGNFHDHLRSQEYSAKQVQYIVYHTLRSLKCLHDQQMLHRDICSKHVLWNAEGDVKIYDLGSATLLTEDNAQRNDEAGCVHYQAPEMIKAAQGDGSYGLPADIWSLGIFAWELASGGLPYEGTTDKQLIWGNTLNDQPPPLSNKWTNEFQNFMERCLEKDPTSRWNVDRLLDHKSMRGVNHIKAFKPHFLENMNL